MRSLVYFLFLALLLATGYFVRRWQMDGPWPQHLPPEQVSGPSLNQIAEQTETERDEHGVIVSDPADDLAGFQPGVNGVTPLALPVGERALYLLELYGSLTREQLQTELRVLRERFQVERAQAMESEFVAGHYEVLRATATADKGSSSLVERRKIAGEGSGASEVQVVYLAQENHVGLYELRDTVEWLGLRLGDH